MGNPSFHNKYQRKTSSPTPPKPQKIPLKIILKELSEELHTTELDAFIVFMIKCIVGGMYNNDRIRSALCLKGGTALSLLHTSGIGRISKDIDISTMPEIDFQKDFPGHSFCDIVQEETHQFISSIIDDPCSIELKLQQKKEKKSYADTNPADMSAYKICATATYKHRKKSLQPTERNFKIEICMNELVNTDGAILKEFSYFNKKYTVLMYSPAQSLAEKMRTILEKMAFYDRDPTRPSPFRARDITDICILFNKDGAANTASLRTTFKNKCSHRHISHVNAQERLLSDPVKHHFLSAHGDLLDTWERYIFVIKHIFES